jgi:hypothetical protein
MKLKKLKPKQKIVPLVILLLLVGGGIGVYVHNQNSNDYVFYSEDTANGCNWKNGKVWGSTAVSQRLITVRVAKKDVPTYVHEAETQGTCARPIPKPLSGKPITDYTPAD